MSRWHDIEGHETSGVVSSGVSDSVILLDCHVPIRGDRVPSKSAKSRLLGEIDRYLVSMEERDCTKATIRGYTWALRDMANALCDAGFTLNPRKIGQIEVGWLLQHHYSGCLHDTKVTNLGMLHGFLKWAGNKQTVRYPTRIYQRPNVRWLTKDQYLSLKATATGIGRVLVHLGGDLGMRRCEILRLKESSFRTGRGNTVLVMGKGHGPGKPRELPWHKDTPVILSIARAHREEAVSRARTKNPSVVPSDSLLVYECGGEVKPYQKSALDNMLRETGRAIGLGPLGFHDLRRTFGKMCHQAGLPIERVAYLLGHADTKTTMTYLGLNIDDAATDMRALEAYQESVEVRKVETEGVSHQNGGPCGIRTQA